MSIEYFHCISNDGYGIARNETPGNRPLLPEVYCLLLLETISDGIDCYICMYVLYLDRYYRSI